MNVGKLISGRKKESITRQRLSSLSSCVGGGVGGKRGCSINQVEVYEAKLLHRCSVPAAGVLSVLGNGTVLLVSCKKWKKLKPPELMTVNLAICDFGFTLLGSPFFITAR